MSLVPAVLRAAANQLDNVAAVTSERLFLSCRRMSSAGILKNRPLPDDFLLL